MRPLRQPVPALCVLVTALLGVVATPACAADADMTPSAARVTIVSAEGTTVGEPLALAELGPALDVHDVSYALRDADGATSTVTVAAGISLGALLRAAGVDLDGFTYLEVPRADGTSILVLHDQAVADAGEASPVVWEDADGAHLVRPSAGDGDVNADDLVTPVDGALTVRLRTGDPLGVRIDASPRRAGPREPVTFTAVLVAGEQSGVEYSWYFDDGGALATGAHVTHRFRRPGTYNVLVNVSAGGRQLDVYDVATIVVPAPRRAQRPAETAAGRGHEGESDTGTGEGDGAGAETGAGSTGPGPSHAGGADQAPTTSAPDEPRPSAPRRLARRTPTAQPKPDPSAETVSGTLLASADTSNLASLVRGGAHRADRDPRRPLHVPMIVWVVAGALALAGAGWVLEARRTLPYWRP